jgi:hypothetical protein
MFRTGIRRIQDYSPRVTGVRRWLTEGRISYELLAEVHSRGEKEIAVFEAIVRDLRLSLGIFRTTARGRFRALDPFVNGYLKNRFSGPALHVHDWAASDCLTSAEWAMSLMPHFPSLQFTASDLMLFLVEFRFPGGDILILEPSGGAVQYVRGPFVCHLDRKEARSAVINRLLASHAKRIVKERGAELRQAIAALGERQSVEHRGLHVRRLPLLHPDADNLAATDSRFVACVRSAFDPLPEPVDVIRTMNIFNPGYFPPDQLRSGRDAVWASLKPGGIWIVGRTVGTSSETASHMASVFERSDEGFRAIAALGGGSEIGNLVLEPRAAHPVA